MKTKKNLILSLNADDKAIDTGKAVETIRESGKQMLTSINSLLDILEEPLKGKFTEVKNEINTMLAGLPDSDKVPAALDANGILRQLLGVLATAQSMMTGLTETAKVARADMIATRASMTTEVENAIKDRIAKGELLTKASAEEQSKSAGEAAAKAAREAIKAEQETLKTRKELLTKAGLPVPTDEAVLLVEEKAFTDRQADVVKRMEVVKPFNLSSERIVTLCWDTDQAQFDNSINLLKEVTANAAKPQGKPAGTPFLKPGSNEQKKPIGVC